MPFAPASSQCVRCGKPFECGIAAGQPRCWCMAEDFKLDLSASAKGCYCPECLRWVAEQDLDHQGHPGQQG